MATLTTLTTARQRLLRELDLGVLIANGSITAIVAGSFTAPTILQNSRWSSSHFADRETVIYRPGTATAADVVRYAGTLTVNSGLLAHTGANYADVTVGTETIELWYDGVRPDLEILDAMNRALEFVHFSSFTAISHGSDLDYDMTASTDTNWTDVGTPTTSAKATTARRAPWGLRSYQLIGDATNEGTQSATLGVVAGRTVSAFSIASCNVGTASLQMYDVTNSATFDLAAVTHSEEEPQLMTYRSSVAPTGCKEMAVRLLGTTNPSDIFWNMLWVYKHDSLRVNLPSFISENFKAPSIFQMRGIYTSASNVYDAQGVELVELKERQDYHYLSHHNDANPHAIILNEGWNCYEWPLVVQSRRPYSDVDSFAAETDDTNCPLHLYMPVAKKRVLSDILIPRNPQSPVWALKMAEAQSEWEAANYVRPVKSVSSKPYYAGVPKV